MKNQPIFYFDKIPSHVWQLKGKTTVHNRFLVHLIEKREGLEYT